MKLKRDIEGTGAIQTVVSVVCIIFAILINTGIWVNHPDCFVFNWIDATMHNWFLVVLNTLFTLPFLILMAYSICIWLPIAIFILVICKLIEKFHELFR